MLFDNDKATAALKEYLDTEQPAKLGDFLNECNSLISVIANTLTSDLDHKEDLMQDARLKVIKELNGFEFNRDKKLYSWLSVVVKHAMIDSIRRDRPDIELQENVESFDPHNESEFTSTIVEQLLPWFTRRFPRMLQDKNPYDILECILSDLMDEKCRKRTLLGNIKLHGFNQSEAKLIYEAVMVKLRILAGVEDRKLTKPNEKSLQPELEDVLGNEQYAETQLIFRGLSIRFARSEQGD